MCEYRLDSFITLRLSMDALTLIDTMLLAAFGHLSECLQAMAPAGQPIQSRSADLHQLRASPIGQSLMILAAYAHGGNFLIENRVQQAREHVLRVLYGDPLAKNGYTLPDAFHKSELGKLFQKVQARLDGPDETLLTPKQAYTQMGVSRTWLYTLVKEGKLHPIYFPTGQPDKQEMRLKRSEIEHLKRERAGKQEQQLEEKGS